jgi:hypothetical protein
MTKASMGTSTAQNPSSITLAKQIQMKASFSTLLLLACASLAAPNHKRSGTGLPDISYYLDGVLLKFDLAIPDVCRNDASHPACPPKLASGNAVLTRRNIAVHQTKGQGPQNNTMRAGWSVVASEGGFVEESTVVIFDFPAGQQDKTCKIHFVSRDGDEIWGAPEGPNVYNIWRLNRPPVSSETPPRTGTNLSAIMLSPPSLPIRTAKISLRSSRLRMEGTFPNSFMGPDRELPRLSLHCRVSLPSGLRWKLTPRSRPIMTCIQHCWFRWHNDRD